MGGVDDDIGLYDSATGRSLDAQRIVDLGHDRAGFAMSLAYTTALRGRIVQVRSGSYRVHYFLDEPMIDEDAGRIGRMLDMSGENALRIIRENSA